jgi:hypothetical protein
MVCESTSEWRIPNPTLHDARANWTNSLRSRSRLRSAKSARGCCGPCRSPTRRWRRTATWSPLRPSNRRFRQTDDGSRTAQPLLPPEYLRTEACTFSQFRQADRVIRRRNSSSIFSRSGRLTDASCSTCRQRPRAGSPRPRVSTQSGVTFGTPEILPARVTAGRTSNEPRAFDILPDGRFVGLIGSGTDSLAAIELRLVQNWFDELKQRVPTN